MFDPNKIEDLQYSTEKQIMDRNPDYYCIKVFISLYSYQLEHLNPCKTCIN